MPEDSPVWAMTTLADELFVYHKDRDIRVYDITEYRLKRTFSLRGLGGVSDMAACDQHHCIYVGDHGSNVVHRVAVIDQTR